MPGPSRVGRAAGRESTSRHPPPSHPAVAAGKPGALHFCVSTRTAGMGRDRLDKAGKRGGVFPRPGRPWRPIDLTQLPRCVGARGRPPARTTGLDPSTPRSFPPMSCPPEPNRADNLRRWKESGQPLLWVEWHRGKWDHADWLLLLDTLRESAFWPLPPAAVARVLEHV